MPVASINKVDLANIGSINNVNIANAASINKVDFYTVVDSISLSDTSGEWSWDLMLCYGSDYITVTSSGAWTSTENDANNAFSYVPSTGSNGTGVSIYAASENYGAGTYSLTITFTCGTASAYYYGIIYPYGMTCG